MCRRVPSACGDRGTWFAPGPMPKVEESHTLCQWRTLLVGVRLRGLIRAHVLHAEIGRDRAIELKQASRGLLSGKADLRRCGGAS